LFIQIKHLFIKDIMIEWRQKYALNAALLYVLSTVFITYLVFQNFIDPVLWNALFWIIIVFVSINTVSHSFVLESKNRHYYYYTIASPQAVIMAKIIYNNLIMFIFTFLTYLIFSLFFGGLIQNNILFYLTILLGSMGFSSMLTMTSAIAWKANNSFSLVAVLGFPLALPLLIVLIRLTKMALGIFVWAEALKFLLILLLLNFIIVALAYILFPFIWKD